jgi:hypothetical protein
MNEKLVREAERRLREFLGRDGVHAFHPTQNGDAFVVYTNADSASVLERLRQKLAAATAPLRVMLVRGPMASMA